MKLAVIGCGLASPAGVTTEDHVFFPRVRLPPPAPRAFARQDGASLDVRYAAFIGSAPPVAARLVALAGAALGPVLAAFATTRRGSLAGARAALVTVTAEPRPGIQGDVAAELERALGAAYPVRPVARFRGAAGAFEALALMPEVVAEHEAVILLGADSFVSLDYLAHRVHFPPCEWTLAPRPPGEGAGALLLSHGGETSAAAPLYGWVNAAHTESGGAADDNDEPVDGRALSEAVAALPLGPPWRLASGQFEVDSLRNDEWRIAIARNSERFDERCEYLGLEERLGQLGAAAGVMATAHAFGALRHRTVLPERSGPSPFVAWAISSSGVRGVAACVAEAAA